jgi:hypothetical protein
VNKQYIIIVLMLLACIRTFGQMTDAELGVALRPLRKSALTNDERSSLTSNLFGITDAEMRLQTQIKRLTEFSRVVDGSEENDQPQHESRQQLWKILEALGNTGDVRAIALILPVTTEESKRINRGRDVFLSTPEEVAVNALYNLRSLGVTQLQEAPDSIMVKDWQNWLSSPINTLVKPQIIPEKAIVTVPQEEIPVKNTDTIKRKYQKNIKEKPDPQWNKIWFAVLVLFVLMVAQWSWRRARKH